VTFHVRDMLGDSRTLDVMGATVVYNPAALSAADFEVIYSEEAGTSRMSAVIEALSHTILSWDLVDDQGDIPVTADGIRRLPMGVLNAVFDAIDESAGPSDAEGKDSPKLSSTPPSDSTPPQQTFPNGGESSRQPDTSVSPLGSSPANIPAG
jgi:hypothetical protein